MGQGSVTTVAIMDIQSLLVTKSDWMMKLRNCGKKSLNTKNQNKPLETTTRNMAITTGHRKTIIITTVIKTDTTTTTIRDTETNTTDAIMLPIIHRMIKSFHQRIPSTLMKQML